MIPWVHTLIVWVSSVRKCTHHWSRCQMWALVLVWGKNIKRCQMQSSVVKTDGKTILQVLLRKFCSTNKKNGVFGLCCNESDFDFVFLCPLFTSRQQCPCWNRTSKRERWHFPQHLPLLLKFSIKPWTSASCLQRKVQICKVRETYRYWPF